MLLQLVTLLLCMKKAHRGFRRLHQGAFLKMGLGFVLKHPVQCLYPLEHNCKKGHSEPLNTDLFNNDSLNIDPSNTITQISFLQNNIVSWNNIS